MQWFYNLKISAKLISGFLVIALIAGVVGIVGMVNIDSVVKLDQEMYSRHTASMPELSEVARAYLRQRVYMRDLFIETNRDNLQGIVDQYRTQRQGMTDSAENYRSMIVDDESLTIIDSLLESDARYGVLCEEIIENILGGDMDSAYALYSGGTGTELAQEIQKYIDELFAIGVRLAKESSDLNASTAKTSDAVMLTTIIIGILIAIILGVAISRTISRPIGQLVSAADMLALGDVNVNVASKSKDEIGTLMASFDRMAANIRSQALTAERVASGDLDVEVEVHSDNDLLGIKLAEMVDKNNEVLSNITAASEQVAAGARQISDSSVSLSQGATEQASSIEQLTASIEEIASQTRLNTQNANKANELAAAVKSNAVQGDGQMKEMLKAMDEINESSSNISKIIKVIDDIAFQTNILALNAAVEAARAGQHGKGFAVVAEEVRNLAARSANAAKETTDMIESSIKKADGGMRIARYTAEALGNIVSGIEEVANLVNGITVASNEQELGITQINQGINQVSQVVQTNSATSEEGAAASEELSGQAELLQKMVRMFKLRGAPKMARDADASMQTEKQKKDSFLNEINLKDDIKSRIPYGDFEYGKY